MASSFKQYYNITKIYSLIGLLDEETCILMCIIMSLLDHLIAEHGWPWGGGRWSGTRSEGWMQHKVWRSSAGCDIWTAQCAKWWSCPYLRWISPDWIRNQGWMFSFRILTAVVLKETNYSKYIRSEPRSPK